VSRPRATASRHCKVCDRDLPESAFYRRPHKTMVGRRNVCGECQRNQRRVPEHFQLLVRVLVEEGRQHPSKPDGVCTYGLCLAPAVDQDSLCLRHVWQFRLSPEANDRCPSCGGEMHCGAEFGARLCVRCQRERFRLAVSSLWGTGVTAVSA